MKKIDYQAPEMEVVELKAEAALLDASYGTDPGYGGSGDPDVNVPD